MCSAVCSAALLPTAAQVAVLFELRDDMVGDGVALVFGQALPQPPYDLSGADKREGEIVAEHVPSAPVW
jgi:hypothetical protein